jgi:hypothetical protein
MNNEKRAKKAFVWDTGILDQSERVAEVGGNQ